ncbi:MAG: glutamate-1-semialdehyde 2,1-aminomutase [Deltaproteobacteria bacterium]|nr:glutamate-1-semialdehyde 2,1-aminomutase [Deltaproteobacteria bacterium]MBW2446153.1 glutamate-1-semialdehyde 2,1-aminomutase [Deltaproteobacteria bacterium]
MARDRSRKLMTRARRVIPGGVNSPVRAYGSVGGVAPFIERGKGARVIDVDGNEYIDYVGSWGPLILGHANPGVLRAVRKAMARGTSFGAPTEIEVELAEAICRALPSVDRVRMVSSGTEATMSAIRLARGVTGRDRILKFDGCYHGHVDSLLVGAGSGVATLGIPGSPGVPEAMTELTVQAPYNDLDAVEDAFRRWPDELAAVLVEPVAGNMGCVLPEPGFLQGLRELCTRHGALLIFDEVMTGFRVAWGGAQRRYRVKPDLTCLGKVVGGGLPAAAYGGRRDLMKQVAPDGPVYQAGTLSGNPLAMAAGLETLHQLEKPGVYEGLAARTQRLAEGLEARARDEGVELCAVHVGGMFGFFFHPGPVRSFDDAKKAHAGRFRKFFATMLDEGVYLAPSPFEAGFVSTAHRPGDLTRTLEAASRALRRAARTRG